MDKTQQDIADLNFIISEIDRFLSMPFNEMKVHFQNNKADIFCQVPHPSGKGHLQCGRRAFGKFSDIAKRHLLTQPHLHRRTDTEQLKQAIIKEFSNVLLRESKETDEKRVAVMLSAAVKRIERSLTDITYYIPCVVVVHDEPDQFSIGPVQFIWMERFLKEIESEVAPKHFSEDLCPYFTKFKWVAEVTILQCDNETSRLKADFVVEMALHFLRLLFAERHGKRLRQAHMPGIQSRGIELRRKRNGKLLVLPNWKVDGAQVAKDWFAELEKSPSVFYLKAMALVLEGILNPSCMTHLHQRYLDSLSWYGQGVNELIPAAKISKYVTGLERLTITKKPTVGGPGLRKTVSARAALLCFDPEKDDFQKWFDLAEEVYDCRSDLLHGAMSPFDDTVKRHAVLAEEIARRSLFRGLELFVSLGQKTHNATPSDLEKEYQSYLLKFRPK